MPTNTSIEVFNLERRGGPAELRARGRRLEGLAAPFNRPADLGGGITEVIKAGAFAASLRAGGDVLLLSDHDPKALLARTGNGSLKLWESEAGLEFSAEIVDTSTGRDVLALAEAHALGGMSFGFKVEAGGEVWSGNRRELRAVQLAEISAISSWPAYSGTRVEARQRAHSSVARAMAWLNTVRVGR